MGGGGAAQGLAGMGRDGVPTQGSGSGQASGLGRGDDAGGLEDVARMGREKCREIYALMSARSHEDSDEE